KVHGATPIAELEKQWKNARSAVKSLEKAGAVAIERRDAEPDPFFATPVARDTPHDLTEPQQAAVTASAERVRAAQRHGFLLDGVTASGKTEVYLRAVGECVAHGRSAIVLVPEIALTPQLVTRFRARIGDAIAVLHSGLTESERHRMWRSLRAG